MVLGLAHGAPRLVVRHAHELGGLVQRPGLVDQHQQVEGPGAEQRLALLVEEDAMAGADARRRLDLAHALAAAAVLPAVRPARERCPPRSPGWSFCCRSAHGQSISAPHGMRIVSVGLLGWTMGGGSGGRVVGVNSAGQRARPAGVELRVRRGCGDSHCAAAPAKSTRHSSPSAGRHEHPAAGRDRLLRRGAAALAAAGEARGLHQVAGHDGVAAGRGGRRVDRVGDLGARRAAGDSSPTSAPIVLADEPLP